MARETAEERPGQRAGTLSELRRIGLRNLIPVSQWLRERPWDPDLVKWFLFLTLFPLFMISWGSLTNPKLADVAFIYAIYFSTIWGVVLYFFLAPEKIGVSDIVRVGLFTAVIGGFGVGVFDRLPFMTRVLAETSGPNVLGRLASFTVGVGLVEETVKLLPLYWIFVRNAEPGSVREITYLGCISGFAFGVSEAVVYSIGYANSVSQGNLGFEQYIVVQFTRLITLPLLHAMFAGIAAHFLALGVHHPPARRGLILVGLLLASVLHGVYNTFSSTVIGFVVALVTVLMFIAYTRSTDAMQAVIAGPEVETTERDEA